MFLNWWTLSLFLCFYHGYPLNAWVYMPVSSPRSSNRVTSGDVVFVDKTDDTNSSASRSISILTEICFIFLESATSYTAVGLRFIDEILHTMTRFYRSLGRSFYVWLSSYSRTRALASPIAASHNVWAALSSAFSRTERCCLLFHLSFPTKVLLFLLSSADCSNRGFMCVVLAFLCLLSGIALIASWSMSALISVCLFTACSCTASFYSRAACCSANAIFNLADFALARFIRAMLDMSETFELLMSDVFIPLDVFVSTFVSLKRCSC